MTTRTHRSLPSEDLAEIAGALHAWRTSEGGYEDRAGFCKSAVLDEIASHDFILAPGRYVGMEDAEVDDLSLDDRYELLRLEILDAFAESDERQQVAVEALGRVGGSDAA